MKKYHIDNLFIEITRRCNMRCEHCLRGAAQRVDIQSGYVSEFLKQVSSVYSLTITGGEPSLNVEGILHLLKELKKNKVSVEYFYIVTNGSKSTMSQKFVDACIDLYKYQDLKSTDSNFMPMLQMSDDEYHNQKLHHKVVEALDVYKFFSVRKNRYTRDNLLKEGRSRYGRKLLISDLTIEDDERILGDVYLNALGYITTDCDMSYKTQNKKKICHYSKFPEYLQSVS